MIKVQYYFFINECWQNDGVPTITLDKLPSLKDKIQYGNKTYIVVDVDQEYDIYDLYLEEA